MSAIDDCFKLLPIGRIGVGKSCLIMRFADDTFTPELRSSIGVDFKNKFVQLGSQLINLRIWDTASQERYIPIPSSYFKGVTGFLLAFDVTDKESFNAVDKYLLAVNTFATNAYVILVGTKCDLESQRVIGFDMGKEKADEAGIEYMETSSKLSINVEEVFLKVASEIIHNKISHWKHRDL